MEAEAKYTYVGAAVLALIAALVIAVVWLKRTGAERDFARYTIHFEEQALDGLAVGSDVNMRGIVVGHVLSYELAPGRLNRARVDVRVDRHTPVRENTVAVITRNFVTGIAQIRLVTAEPAGPPLARVPDGERFPVIAEGRSDLSEITGRVTELGEMAGEVLNNVNRMFTSENRLAVSETLGNLRDLTRDLNRRLARLDGVLTDIGGAARESKNAAAQIASAADKVGRGVESTADDTRALIGELRAVATQTQAAVAQVAQSLVALETKTAGAVRGIETSAAHIDDQVLVAVGELRSSLEAIHRSLDRLHDPRTALLGPERARLGPGEKLP